MKISITAVVSIANSVTDQLNDVQLTGTFRDPGGLGIKGEPNILPVVDSLQTNFYTVLLWNEALLPTFLVHFLLQVLSQNKVV